MSEYYEYNEIIEHLYKNKDDWGYIRHVYEFILLKEEEE